jgi:HD superfamily phosphohydrolase
VSRFEHSLGVFLLLKRLNASRLETVAGLLHDISHTAFSHAVDFLFDTEEQAHHESLKPEFLTRPDIVEAIGRIGYAPEQFYHDAVYTLLERPLPWLCADRLDYFLRDGQSCGVVSSEEIDRILNSLLVVDDMICLSNVDVAREVRGKYAEMNQRWWSGPVEAFIYNEFADALREALDQGALRYQDLLADDEQVLSCLRAARNPIIQSKLDSVVRVPQSELRDYQPRVAPKSRWLDPPVAFKGTARPLSQIEGTAAKTPAARAG